MRKILILAVLLVAAIAVGTSFAATKGVSVKDDRFSPTSVSVSKGDTVKWTWAGKNPHNVKGEGGLSSKTMTKGTYSKRFRRSGTYDYECTIHPGMEGKVKVR